jgi:hypothetical protein
MSSTPSSAVSGARRGSHWRTRGGSKAWRLRGTLQSSFETRPSKPQRYGEYGKPGRRKCLRQRQRLAILKFRAYQRTASTACKGRRPALRLLGSQKSGLPQPLPFGHSVDGRATYCTTCCLFCDWMPSSRQSVVDKGVVAARRGAQSRVRLCTGHRASRAPWPGRFRSWRAAPGRR